MNKDRLIQLYKNVRRIRLVEEAIANNYYNEVREMHTPIHLCDGEEAIAVGVCSNLRKQDMIFSNHRCHGHYLAKGGDLKTMLAELHGKAAGCCGGKGGSMHLCDISRGIMLTSAIVAGNVSVATGYAMAQKMDGADAISVVFFGDGASEEGSVYESICFASMHKLPILYVCENNRVAISTPYELREPGDTVASKFTTLLSTVTLDGNDVEKVYLEAGKCIEKIQKGEGPVLMECSTYRLRAHSNIGDGVDGIYRTKEEQADARKQDPLVRLRDMLRKNEDLTDIELESIDEKIRDEIEEAFLYARNAEFPVVEDLYTNVYA